MTKTTTKTAVDQRTLNEVVLSMEANMVRTGSYRIADVRRLIGDPLKGTGISVPMPASPTRKR